MNTIALQISTVHVSRAGMKAMIHKNLMRGLAVSTFLHLSIVSGYYLQQYHVSDDENIPTVRVRLMKYSELGPPPSLISSTVAPPVGISVSAKPSIGTSIPVPDVEVNPEQTIASQQELSEVQSIATMESAEQGDLVVEEDIVIEEEPSPELFIPVEKFPAPVKQVKPEYPDLARRAGIEGVVWVRILVDKQGHAKKALIIKSDTEIFNEAALQAALQWVFTPALMNSGPVMVWVAVPFRFQLNKISS